MTRICSLQTVRIGKRWFYIIISLAITVCSCTELIQLSPLLLVGVFLRKMTPILEELNIILEKKMLTQTRKRTAGNITESKCCLLFNSFLHIPMGNVQRMRSKNVHKIQKLKKVKRENRSDVCHWKIPRNVGRNKYFKSHCPQALFCKNSTKTFQSVLAMTL